MATLDCPDWLEPAECSLTLAKNALLWRSQLDGSVQTVRQPGERWVMNLTLPPVRIKTALAAERRAFFNRLAGGADRLRLWNLAQPMPLGTLRGLTTLGAAASRGASTLTLAGALSAPNLLSNGGMWVDSNADGVSDQVTAYSSGSTGTVTADRPTVAPYGPAQRVSATALGTTFADRIGVQMARVNVSALFDKPMTLAADVMGTGVGTILYMTINWIGGDGSLISDSPNYGTSVPTGSMARRSVTGIVPAGAYYADCYIIATTAASVGAATLTVDRVQLEIGSAPGAFAGLPTLLAGDMLGCNGQLFEVRDAVSLAGNGTGVVTLNNRVRAPITSGAAVTWDRPTALFITPTTGASVSYSPGWQQAIACDLEEVWDA